MAGKNLLAAARVASYSAMLNAPLLRVKRWIQHLPVVRAERRGAGEM